MTLRAWLILTLNPYFETIIVDVYYRVLHTLGLMVSENQLQMTDKNQVSPMVGPILAPIQFYEQT